MIIVVYVPSPGRPAGLPLRIATGSATVGSSAEAVEGSVPLDEMVVTR